jgi:hypothetical protein
MQILNGLPENLLTFQSGSTEAYQPNAEVGSKAIHHRPIWLPASDLER